MSTSMFGGWPCSYWPTYPNCQCDTCDGHNPPKLPAFRIAVFNTIVAFSGSIVNVCQEAHLSVVLPHHSRQVTSGPYSKVTAFQSQCFGFEVLGHALSMQPNRPTTVTFLLCQVVT